MQETSARSKYEENNSSAAGQASTNTVDRCRFPVEKGEQSTVCCLLACLPSHTRASLLPRKEENSALLAHSKLASAQLNSAQQNQNSATPSTTSGKRRKSPSTRHCRARADQQQRAANPIHPQRPLKSFFLFSHGFSRQKTLGKKKIWRTCNVWDRKITPCMFQMGAKKT